MKELFHILKQKNLSPNGFYILYSLQSKEKLELTIPYSAEITRLKHNGFLNENATLTDLAKLTLNEILSISVGQENVSKSITPTIDENFIDNVKRYRETFPAGVRNGRVLRTGVAELTPRLLWFFKSYPQFSWEQVLLATEKYVESFGKDLTYCKSASYFIKKEDRNRNPASELATWCENLEEEESSNTEGDFGGFYEAI